MSATSSLLPSNSSRPALDCFSFRRSFLVLSTFSVANILLVLPLSVLVLHLGFCRWLRRRSGAAVTPAGHSDVFTYHMVVMETLAVACCLLYCVGVSAGLTDVTPYFFNVFFCLWSTKISFHALTCVEHYLAVVHPVAYRRLRSPTGVRVRNATVGCVWLLCLLWRLVIVTASFVVCYFCFLALALAVVCFCCASVLRALRRPGPGDTERVDPAKRRASNTVLVVMGALCFCLGGTLACNAAESLGELSDEGCAVLASSAWFSLPSSLVLPLLFLQRAGKLPWCKG